MFTFNFLSFTRMKNCRETEQCFHRTRVFYSDHTFSKINIPFKGQIEGGDPFLTKPISLGKNLTCDRNFVETPLFTKMTAILNYRITLGGKVTKLKHNYINIGKSISNF